jgi:short-subunit dehydrogenase
MLALSGRRVAALKGVAGHTDTLLPLDVTDPTAVTAAYTRLLAQWDNIDLLVYCAERYTPMRGGTFDLKAMQDSLAVNLGGACNLLDAVLPRMIQEKSGNICLIANVAGQTALPNALAYGPGKAALINLAEGLHQDLAPRGIGVYLVNPGFGDARLSWQDHFELPAEVAPEIAARAIMEGLEGGEFEIHFPRRFTAGIKLLAMLPPRWRFALIRKLMQ